MITTRIVIRSILIRINSNELDYDLLCLYRIFQNSNLEIMDFSCVCLNMKRMIETTLRVPHIGQIYNLPWFGIYLKCFLLRKKTDLA